MSGLSNSSTRECLGAGSRSWADCVLHWHVVYDRMTGVEARRVRFPRGSRKHRIGLASARHVIETVTPTTENDEVTKAVIVRWVGNDERAAGSWRSSPSNGRTVAS